MAKQISSNFSLVLCFFTFIAFLDVAPSWGQDGEQPPKASDFQVTTLAKGAAKTGEPISMAVLPDRRVLHTSRDGRVWLTTADATTSLAGTIPVYSHDEDGLQGIAIDADFNTNRWVYVYYAPPLATPTGDAPSTADNGPAAFVPFKGYNQLSRMKLTGAGTLDSSTEQKILQVPADRGICCHAGGEIDFDAQGNLYLSTGDDTNPFGTFPNGSDGFSPIDERPTRNPAFDAQRSSANTNDLRGKLLRIKVSADGTYSVPGGNLFAPGTDRARPEIYAMGFRNPFRFAVDQQLGWVYLGDYGPDAPASDPNRGPAGQVEFNLIKGPGNYGWPYFHGKNDAYNAFDFATGLSGAKFNSSAPKNNSPNNTGLVDLPQAQPAWIAYDNCSIPEFGCGSESPMGGETYRFNAENPYPTKFPVYYDGKNFAYEFGRGWFRVLTVDPDGVLLRIEPFLDSLNFLKQPINAEFGPDGALYVLDYGKGSFAGDEFSAVYRIDYVQGTRSPIAVATADRLSGPTPLTVKFSSGGSVDPDGGIITYAWDFDGDGTIDSTEANPTFSYDKARRWTASLKVTDDAGQSASASVNLTAGNTAPTVTIKGPPNGGIFDHGALLRYTVTVTDPEDGTIDCGRVNIKTLLGHDEHAHGDQILAGCSGQLKIPAAWENKAEHTYFLLTASYTDKGVATPDLELEGNAECVLEQRTQQAEHFDEQQGTQNVRHAGAEGGQRIGFIEAGDWLKFNRINLSGIDHVIARVTSTAPSGLQIRADSPTGPIVATIAVPNTGGFDIYDNSPPAPIADPGGTHDLFIVFTGAGMDLDEFVFQGVGVTENVGRKTSTPSKSVGGAAPGALSGFAGVPDRRGVTGTAAVGKPVVESNAR